MDNRQASGRHSATSGVLQVVVFELDERRYGLPLAAVERVLHAVDVTPLPQVPNVVWGIIDVQGQIVPVLSLRERFGLPERAIGVNDQFILAQTPRQTVALVVDAVCGVLEQPAAEVIESDEILPNLDQVAGVIQLPDGMVLIHNLERFLSLDEERALVQATTRQVNHKS